MSAAATSIPTTSSDIIVTLEDQEKINRFAQLSAKLGELSEDTNSLKGDLQNIEDLVSELEMKMLEDDEEDGGKIALMRGDIFAQLSYEDAQKWVEEKQQQIKQDIEVSMDKMGSIREEMQSLKAFLYSKFGKNNIHLEEDD